MRSKLLVVLGVVALFAGCARPKTELMKKLEADGAGNLSDPNVSYEAIQDWLRKKGADYIVALNSDCKQREKAGVSAEYLASFDGRVCKAASELGVYAPGPPRKAQPGFWGGNK